MRLIDGGCKRMFHACDTGLDQFLGGMGALGWQARPGEQLLDHAE